jgi:hypothetical protein
LIWISRCSAADQRLGEAARLAVEGLERGSRVDGLERGSRVDGLATARIAARVRRGGNERGRRSSIGRPNR